MTTPAPRIELGVPTYRFLPLALRQVDPLIRRPSRN